MATWDDEPADEPSQGRNPMQDRMVTTSTPHGPARTHYQPSSLMIVVYTVVTLPDGSLVTPRIVNRDGTSVVMMRRFEPWQSADAEACYAAFVEQMRRYEQCPAAGQLMPREEPS